MSRASICQHEFAGNRKAAAEESDVDPDHKGESDGQVCEVREGGQVEEFEVDAEAGSGQR
jgi:hypothetical protein